MRAKNHIFILLLTVFILSIAVTGVRGELDCYMTEFKTPYCQGDEVEVFQMSNFYNAHAATGWEYKYRICCDDKENPGGLSVTVVEATDCPGGPGASAPVIRLSNYWNAHVQNPYVYSTYPVLICLNADYEVECRYGEYRDTCSDIGEDYECLAAINKDTNAHLGQCYQSYPYETKICCKASSLVPPIDCNLVSVDTVDTSGCSGPAGECEYGDTLGINVTVEGNCSDEDFWHLQVDARSVDGLCNIMYGPGRDMFGMSDDVGEFVGNENEQRTVTAQWTVLGIPSNCANKDFTAGTAGPDPPACLRDDWPGQHNKETCTYNVAGSFTLGDATDNAPIITVRKVGKDTKKDPPPNDYYKVFGMYPVIVVTAWDPEGAGIASCTIDGQNCFSMSMSECGDWSGDCYKCIGQDTGFGTHTDTITCTDSGPFSLQSSVDVTYTSYDPNTMPTPWGLVQNSESHWSCDFLDGEVTINGSVYDPAAVEKVEWMLRRKAGGPWQTVETWTEDDMTYTQGESIFFEYTIPYDPHFYVENVEDVESFIRVFDGAEEVITSYEIIKPPPIDWAC